MKRLLVAEQWDEFARAVLPANCSLVQRREMRRAFYAGAFSILFCVIPSLTPDGEPTEEDMQAMQNIWEELKDFFNMTKEGKV